MVHAYAMVCIERMYDLSRVVQMVQTIQTIQTIQAILVVQVVDASQKEKSLVSYNCIKLVNTHFLTGCESHALVLALPPRDGYTFESIKWKRQRRSGFVPQVGPADNPILSQHIRGDCSLR
jgi:hypothetical protein